jgi:hypothetical protein
MNSKIVMLKPSNQQVEDYINAIASISAYAYGLETTDLPALTISPDWYADYAQKLVLAKAHCQYWNYGIMPVLTEFPNSIVNLNTLIQEDIINLNQNLEQLQENPDDTNCIKAVSDTLARIKREMLPVNNVMSNLNKGTYEFTEQLTADTQTLDTISTDAYDSAVGDKELIKKLTDSVENLQRIIYDKRQLVKLKKGLQLDFLITISAIKVVVGIVSENPKLVVKAVITGIKDAYDIIVAEGADVKEEQDLIKLIQDEMGEVDKTIATLQSISKSFNNLEQENQQAQLSLNWIRQFWQAYFVETNQIMDDMQKMLEDITNKDIADAIVQLKDLSNKWNDFEEFASVLAGVTYKLNPNEVYVDSALNSK